jgi:outer membrane receptor protein involved in Fe transport
MILVTGTRIRGGHPMSPVTTVTQKEAREAGQTSISDIILALPQNYSGGQNPGVGGGGGQGSENQNTSSASSINLRGLGTDATLTLLDGHRVAYNGIVQAVDVSQFPLASLDRIEVIADGASALYGSDAVGGVANVILKRDFEGVTASARLGGATDGGDVQQQYDLVGGRRWSTGGFMIAGDVSRSTAIDVSDRAWIRTMNGTSTLLPAIDQHSLVLTAHQDLTSNLRWSMDANYNHRWSAVATASYLAAPYDQDGGRAVPKDRTYNLSSRLDLDLGGDWSSYVSGTYGQDRLGLAFKFYSDGANYDSHGGVYTNSFWSGEAGAEGPLFHLPGGDARLALGGGYRRYGLDFTTTDDASGVTKVTAAFDDHRDSVYGFAELYAPLVSPEAGIPAIDSLDLSGAVRFEDYPGMARIATPKFGVRYAPTADVDIKAGWGRSFKTPTLQQQFQPVFAETLDVGNFGTTAHGTGPVLSLSGGSPDLKPERATSWSTTIDFHPRRIAGLDLQVSYFHIAYRNRIITPLASFSGALDNPVYAGLIAFNPDAAAQAAAIALTPDGLHNYSSVPYDPATITALVDDRYRNAANQTIHGIDLTGRYRFPLGPGDHLTLAGSASHLDSKQLLASGLDVTALAGTLYHPPHWRARGGATWESKTVTLTGYVNYLGPVLDNRLAAAPTLIRGMTSFDLTATWRAPVSSPTLGGVDLILSILNLTNVRPAVIAQTSAANPPYDTTNYSAVGRVVSLTVSKHF